VEHNVALGKAPTSEATGFGLAIKPKTIDERIAALESRIDMIAQSFLSVNRYVADKNRENLSAYSDLNRDGVPLDINLLGITKGEPFVLTVKEDAYYLGITPYPSLSAAAQAVSGCRRSGWMFWKLPDGRTARDAFRTTRKK